MRKIRGEVLKAEVEIELKQRKSLTGLIGWLSFHYYIAKEVFFKIETTEKKKLKAMDKMFVVTVEGKRYEQDKGKWHKERW